MFIPEDDLLQQAPVAGELLDHYLANGFFRMRQYLFTTYYIDYEGSLHDVFWLRTRVADVKTTAKHKRLLKSTSAFTIHYGPAFITPEAEELFRRYSQQLSFRHSASIQEVLFGEHDYNLFNTQMIEVRDGERLIAVGYYDCGSSSIMGILNIYDPAYSKHSLGKLLILLKLEYCRVHNIQYYYTGYIALGLHHFDYKTFPNAEAVDVLLHGYHVWVPYAPLGKEGLKQFALLKTEDVNNNADPSIDDAHL